MWASLYASRTGYTSFHSIFVLRDIMTQLKMLQKTVMTSPFVIVGLGNPGEKYVRTRHNLGRLALEMIAAEKGAELSSRGKNVGLVGVVPFGDTNVTFLLPDTFMNKSGSAVKTLVATPRDAASLIVVYDDIDLPWDCVRIAWNRGSGGHNGVESVIKGVKTKEFIRVRIGVAPVTPGGKLKKPKGEDGVVDYLMSNISKREDAAFPDVVKRIEEAIELIVTKGLERAMNTVNTGVTIEKK